MLQLFHFLQYSVQANGNANGNIQTLRESNHRDPDFSIGICQRIVRSATKFVAEQQGYATIDVKVVDRNATFGRIGNIDLVSVISETVKTCFSIIDSLVSVANQVQPFVGTLKHANIQLVFSGILDDVY